MFISAAKTIAPMFQKYSETKQEAEDFLLKDGGVSGQSNIVILRPGMVWHPNQRKWAFPLKLATDFGFKFNQDVV